MFVPLLIGAGVLLLLASGGGAKSAAPAASAAGAYDKGRVFGYAEGLAGKPSMTSAQVQASDAAKASGDPSQFYVGYVAGYPAGLAAKKKAGSTGTTGTTSAATSCVAPGMPYDLFFCQRGLMAAGALAAFSAEGKDNLDGDCGPITTAAIKQFQSSHGLPASGTIDAQTSDALRPYMSV